VPIHIRLVDERKLTDLQAFCLCSLSDLLCDLRAFDDELLLDLELRIRDDFGDLGSCACERFWEHDLHTGLELG
jgi:hypothetical protein